MILTSLLEADALSALRSVRLPGEAVITDPAEVLPAALFGFTRLAVVRDRYDRMMRVFGESRIPVLDLSRSSWGRFPHRDSSDRHALMSGLVSAHARPHLWVGRLFAELEGVLGRRLPEGFKAFARRPLEYPKRYQYVDALSSEVGLSRAAFTQRFLRGGLASPGAYLKWLRVFAAMQVLRSDEHLPTTHAAHRLGYSSSGSLCRAVRTLAGVSTTDLRAPHTDQRVLIRFAEDFDWSGTEQGWQSIAALLRAAA